MDLLKRLKEYIDNSNTIALAAHVRADGDAIGSVGAMYCLLKEMGKEVYMIVPNISEKYKYLPHINEVRSRVPLEEYDLLICLDSSKEDRLNILEEDIKKARHVIQIDHHRKDEFNAEFKIINEEAPANCEIIYDIVRYFKNDISKDIAEYIYLGIMTDTGSFNYERTTGKTYRIAAEMVDKGIDFTKTCKIMNDTYSETKMKLIAYIIDNMEVYCNGKVRIAVLDENICNSLDAKEDDIDGLVNYLRCIEGTIVSIYIRYIGDKTYKVSMRSDAPIDISKIAIQFDGGGHLRAAGFNTKDVDKVKKELIEILERLLESENNRNT